MDSRSLHIAIAFRDNDGAYIRTVAAMLASLLANTRSRLILHVLHDATLAPTGRAALTSMTEHAEQRITFHAIDPAAYLPNVDEASPIMKPLTFATLYRLFLPDLVQTDRLIYLDTDIILDTDISALWTFDMGTALLGAVPDPCLCGALLRTPHNAREQWAKEVARHSVRLGIPMSRYFNAGVLLLDMDTIRRERLFAQALDIVLGEPRLLHPDQDALNKVFFECSVVIPKKFNYLLHTDDVTGLSEGVWHYSGPHKPWHKSSKDTTQKADRYAHYLAQTPL